MNEDFFADRPSSKKKKSKKGDGEKKSKKKKKKSESGDRMRSSSSGNNKKKKKKRKSESREHSNRHHDGSGAGDSSLFYDQNGTGGIQSQDGFALVPNSSLVTGTFPANDFEQPLKRAPPTRNTSIDEKMERVQKRDSREKETTRQVVADDTMSKDNTVGTVGYATMSRGSSKNSLPLSLETYSAWPGRNFQDNGKPGVTGSSNARRNANSSGLSQASSADSYGSSRVGAVSVTGGAHNGKRSISVAPSSESYDRNQRPAGAVSVANAAPRGKGNPGSGNNGGSSRVGAVSVASAAPRGKGGPRASASSDGYGNQESRVGAVSVASAAPRGKGGPSVASSSDGYGDQASRVGAVSVASAAPRGKGGPRASASSDGYGNQASRVGAVSVASAAPRGKGGPSVASSSDGYGDQASRVGAVSVSSPAQRGKGTNSLRNSMYADSRVGATSVASAASQGKRGSPRSSETTSSRVGAVSVNSAAPGGKGSRPSMANSGDLSEPTSPRVGATTVSGAAPKGKRSAYNARSSSSSTIGTLGTVGTVGAISVNSAAPSGKGGPSVASSAERYGDASQLGAFSVSSAALQGKGRRGSNGGGGTSRDSAVGATSVVSGASSRMTKGSGPSLREEAEHYGDSGSRKKSFRNVAQSVHSDESAASQRGSVDTSASSQKDRVSHFPTSDSYASMSSMNEGTHTENKGRISQFPGEDQYEEALEQHSTRRMRASVSPSSLEENGDNGPAYSASEANYDMGSDNRTDTSGRGEAVDCLSRDRSTRSSISAASQGSDAPPRRGSTGAFFISDGTVDGRQPANFTTSNHNFDSMLEAEVTLSAAFPEGPAPGNIQGVSSADFKVTPFYCSRMFMLLMIFLGVGGIVGAVLGTVVFGGNSSDLGGGPSSPTASPTKPVDLERQAAVRAVLLGATAEATLDDPTTPQNAAYTWIVVEDLLSPVNPSGAVTEENEKVLSRYSLAVFYFATNGEDWFTSEGWIDSERDECDWEFLSCDNPLNYVDKIKSADVESGNNIFGSIPSEIRELSALIEIKLPANRIGEIHPDMRFLSNLKRLDLRTNELTGTFPEFIYGMTPLLYLDLSMNSLNGTLSSSISSLSNLGQLILDSNDLSGRLTNELAGLQSLRELNLSFNFLEGDFHTIVEGLKNLVFIVLERNKLEGKLNGLKLLTDFEELAELSIPFNRMTGTIPPELGSLPLMRQLVFDNNKFTGTIPSELANGAPLQNLILDFNRLDGSVPEILCSIPTLQIIWVDADIACPCSVCLSR